MRARGISCMNLDHISLSGISSNTFNANMETSLKLKPSMQPTQPKPNHGSNPCTQVLVDPSAAWARVRVMLGRQRRGERGEPLGGVLGGYKSTLRWRKRV